MRRAYLVRIDGILRHTHYTPQQTREAWAMIQQGYTLDAIAERLHIPYSSVHYVAFMERVTYPTPKGGGFQEPSRLPRLQKPR